MPSRFADLLEGAAIDLLAMKTPLSTEFLVIHDVSLNECYSLSELIGHILKGYVLSPPLVQHNLLLSGIINGTGLQKLISGEDIFNATLGSKIKATTRPSKRMQSLLKHLAKDFLASRETFSHAFLLRHTITADECFQLSEYAGYLLRGYNHVASVIRDTVLLCGVAGKSLPGELIFAAGLQLDVSKKLKALDAPTI